MLQSLPLTEQDIPVLTPIMAAAFDDDSKIHTGVEHDGPRGYDDGSLLLRLDSPTDKPAVMQRLAQNYDLDELKVFEPSLNDIFVQYAGDGEQEVRK